MMGDFIHYWDRDKCVIPDFPTEDEILFSAYEGGYECNAEIVYCRNGKYYHVSAAHWLEGQWEPIEIDPAQLLIYRLSDFHFAEKAIIAWETMAKEINHLS